MVNWTATEAFHPADVINSRYLDSNVENFEKLGEAMVSFKWDVGDGNLTGYFIPFVMDPIMPSRRSRLNLARRASAWARSCICVGRAPSRAKTSRTTSNPSGPCAWFKALAPPMSRSTFCRTSTEIGPCLSVNLSDTTGPPLTGIRPRLLLLPVTQIGGTYQQAVGDYR